MDHRRAIWGDWAIWGDCTGHRSDEPRHGLCRNGTRSLQEKDGGLSWTASLLAPSGPELLSSGLAIDPLSSSNVYAATSVGIFKSLDAGDSWVAAGPPVPHWPAYSVAIDPVTPSNILAGTAGGLFKSTNGGASWSRRPLASLIYSKSVDSGSTWRLASSDLKEAVYAVAIDPRNPSTLYAANYRGSFEAQTGAPIGLSSTSD